MLRRLVVLVSMLALLFPTTTLAVDPDRPAPIAGSELRLDQPVVTDGVTAPSKLSAPLTSATGTQAVVVQLTEEPVAQVAAEGAGAAAQQTQLQTVEAQQDAVVEVAQSLDSGVDVVGDAQRALNAVVLEINAEALPELASQPAVASIRSVVDYEMDLSETVPYIGGTAVHEAGFTGDGISVAVLDSGIDYTHVAFGGAGTQAAYDAAYGANTGDPKNTLNEGLFPTAKVVGGFDFVGEIWPFGPLAPDEDPIDCGGKPVNPRPAGAPAVCTGGHGSHVADISAGAQGVAPDADLYAVKVCSAVSTSCSGVALIQGMDFATDPNGDGVTDDAVDIINMSLGSPYGQARDDDLAQAVENASAIGVLTVASAGNSSDKPYVTGSPAAAPSALSVAQTTVPSATQDVMEILAPPAIAGLYQAVFQDWSRPLSETGPIEGPVQYGNGAGSNLNGCAAFPAGSLDGKIVLVDRGACDFSLKVANVALGGGEVAIIGLVAPGDPFSGGLAACPEEACHDIPGFMISQADSNTIKGQLANGVTARFDPADSLSLAGHMVGSSSRGPTMLTNIVKPEIGAPGASISAVAGGGTETSPFSGTSGAAPMVTGSAALLNEAFTNRSNAEIKAVLMNTAETEIFNSLAAFGGDLAPISRIGGGEVRVDRALNSPTAAWDKETLQGALSFGQVDVTDGVVELKKTITIRNYTGRAVPYRASAVFRFAGDAAGAVSLSVSKNVTIPPRRTVDVPITLRINGPQLEQWVMNSGSDGANAASLTAMEFDGYIQFDNNSTKSDDDDPMHIAWHVLPRKSGDVSSSASTMAPDGSVTLTNNSAAGTAQIDAYSLLGTSPDLPEGPVGGQAPVVDLKSIGVQTIPVGAGVCSSAPSFLLLFAVNTWERQTHSNAPASFEWQLSTDADPQAEFFVFNLDLALNRSDGRNVTFVQAAGSSQVQAFFFTDHGTNSGNTVLTICGEQIGMNAEDFGTPITADVLAVDAYFTGNTTDAINDVQFAPLGERYLADFEGEIAAADIAPGASKEMTVLDFGPDGTNPSEIGLLLLNDASHFGTTFNGGAPQESEALTIIIE